ncbi:carbohydrate kinase family protein [Colwellia sp. 20A7]|uniref:carbohydrate kinase family protein n=1 Tax=Colwellia sp. 20A7 TaxID=2689569 RepID=UPI001358A0CE|nr:carbohydrate kinase [Colwellia sp. 20A7]
MNQPFNVVGLGEALWDIFPDSARFGGAPTNMACILSGIAKHDVSVKMISAVGKDTLGNDAIEALVKHNVDTSFIQVNAFPTGTVHINLDELHQATYTFAENSAWDHLVWDDQLHNIAKNTQAVCFGSLAQRNETSRITIMNFLKAMSESAIKVFDVNLRPPFYTKDIILNSLNLANVLKLNEEELPFIAELMGISGNESSLLKEVQKLFELTSIIFTKGEEGSILIHRDELIEVPVIPTSVIDTVGAGDSFTAACILGLLRNEKLTDIAKFAAYISSYVCSQRGATPELPQSMFVFN